MEKHTNCLNKISNVILIALTLIAAGIILRFSFGDDIWYDEVFSAVFSNRNIKEIISLTSNDVHPPFYYIYLKAISALLTLLPFGMSDISAMKLASFLPLVGLIIIALTYIRKKFSFICASFFIFLISTMPKLSEYYVEIRMYSLALFLTTCAFLCMLEIIRGKKSRASIALFFICGIFTAYTQYYALIGIAGLYIILGVYLLRSMKKIKTDGTSGDKEALKDIKAKLYAYIICLVLSIIAYIPWLSTLMRQLDAVTASYWIEPMSIRSIFGCIKYIYTPSLTGGSFDYIPAAIMLFGSGIIIVLFLLRNTGMANGWHLNAGANMTTDATSGSDILLLDERSKKLKLLTAFAGFFELLLITGCGFIFSALGHPIFVYRYMIPVLGIFYFGLSYMMSEVITPNNLEKKEDDEAGDKEKADTGNNAKGAGQNKLKAGLRAAAIAVILLCFIYGGYCSMRGFYNEESKKLKNIHDTLSALSAIPDDAVIITNFDQITTLMDYYFKEYFNKDVSIYLYEAETENIVNLMFETSGQELTRDELFDILKDGESTVMFFGSFNSREDILADWETRGATYTERGSYLLERYWFNIYYIRV